MKQLLLLGSLLLSVDAFSQVGINTNSLQKIPHVNVSLQITNELNVGGNASTAESNGSSEQILTSRCLGIASSRADVNTMSGRIASINYMSRIYMPSKM